MSLWLSMCHAAVVEADSFAPPFGETVLVIGSDKDSIEDYVHQIGIVPAGFMIYTNIQGAESLFEAGNHGAGDNFAQYFVQKYPHTVIQLGLYMVGALQGVVDGVYDDNIKKIGEWIKQAKCPVYLRIGYEFDLGNNHYDPHLYKTAFRRIVYHLREQHVTNVAFVWHSGCYPFLDRDIMQWYPGNEYVDWVAISYFNTGQQAKAAQIARKARELRKPFMIAETTPAGVFTQRGKMEYLESLFRLVQREHVQFVSYINCDWDSFPMFKNDHWGDSRIQYNAEIKSYWLKQLSASKILQSSPDLFNLLAYGHQDHG